jgi:hypothetical protein
VESALKDSIHDAIPDAAKSLDEQLHQTFPFEWSVLPTLPVTRMALTTKPTSARVAPDQLRIILGAEVKGVGRAEFLDLQEQRRARADSIAEQLEKKAIDIWELTRFGTVGLNPALANELFTALTPSWPEFFELDSGTIPQIGEILNRGTLATIWPDLNSVDLADQRVRAFVSLPRAPRIEFHRTGIITMHLRVEDFHLTFMVNRGGTWQRYSHLHIGVDAPVNIGIVDRVLQVGAGMAAVTVEGGFDPGYNPEVPIFERDMALVVARTLFDVLAEQGMITMIEIPNFPLGGEFVTLNGFKVTEPFLQLDIVKAE